MYNPFLMAINSNQESSNFLKVSFVIKKHTEFIGILRENTSLKIHGALDSEPPDFSEAQRSCACNGRLRGM